MVFFIIIINNAYNIINIRRYKFTKTAINTQSLQKIFNNSKYIKKIIILYFINRYNYFINGINTINLLKLYYLI